MVIPALALAALVIPARALAEPTQKEKEAAQKLFIEGHEALDRGEQELACAKFRSSLALFPVANTVANVAQCEEREGKLLAARQSWKRAIALFASGDERLAAAGERLAALEARIPTVKLVLSAVPADARILVDGEPVPRKELGVPLWLAPGSHAIIVDAPGRREQRAAVTLAEGDRKELALAQGPLLPPAASRGGRIAGFISGGVGLAGFVVAGITGGVLLSKDGQIDKACRDPKTCSPDSLSSARSLILDGKPLMIANAVSWGVGIAGVGLGAVLLIVNRGSAAPKAALSPLTLPGGGGASLWGRF